MKELNKNKNSIYYQSLENWLKRNYSRIDELATDRCWRESPFFLFEGNFPEPGHPLGIPFTLRFATQKVPIRVPTEKIHWVDFGLSLLRNCRTGTVRVTNYLFLKIINFSTHRMIFFK